MRKKPLDFNDFVAYWSDWNMNGRIANNEEFCTMMDFIPKMNRLVKAVKNQYDDDEGALSVEAKRAIRSLYGNDS